MGTLGQAMNIWVVANGTADTGRHTWARPHISDTVENSGVSCAP